MKLTEQKKLVTFNSKLDGQALPRSNKIVGLNMLQNCPITIDDILRADAIFGMPTPLCKEYHSFTPKAEK
eukprot:8856789-Ditylum_brightwellii.AAC.1